MFSPGLFRRVPACLLAAGFVLGGVPLLRLPGAPSELPAPAHVRLWKTELRDFPFLRVTMTAAGSGPRQHPAAHDLGNIGPGYMFDGYVEVPAGPGTLDTFDAPAGGKGPAPHPLVSLPVNLAPGAFVTVLLNEPQKPKGPPRMENFVDSIDNPAVAQLTVRGLGSSPQDVRVMLGDALNAQFSGTSSYLQMRGLRPGPYTVHTTGTHLDGKLFDWSTSVDFKQHPHQTLLIYPDPYGHIHPRLSVDGEAPPSLPPGDKGH